MECEGSTKSSVLVGEERPWAWMSLERKRTKGDSCDEGSSRHGRSCGRHEDDRRRPRVRMVMAGRRLVDDARLRDLIGGERLAMFIAQSKKSGHVFTRLTNSADISSITNRNLLSEQPSGSLG